MGISDFPWHSEELQVISAGNPFPAGTPLLPSTGPADSEFTIPLKSPKKKSVIAMSWIRCVFTVARFLMKLLLLLKSSTD
jgi:hypothetical protein